MEERVLHLIFTYFSPEVLVEHLVKVDLEIVIAISLTFSLLSSVDKQISFIFEKARKNVPLPTLALVLSRRAWNSFLKIIFFPPDQIT